MADVINDRGLQHAYPTRFIIKLQRFFRSHGIPFGNGGNQNRICFVHQKGPYKNGAKEGVLADQGIYDMIQLRMAGENIRLSQVDCLFAGGDMHFLTGILGGEMLLKQGAEPGRFPF